MKIIIIILIIQLVSCITPTAQNIESQKIFTDEEIKDSGPIISVYDTITAGNGSSSKNVTDEKKYTENQIQTAEWYKKRTGKYPPGYTAPKTAKEQLIEKQSQIALDALIKVEAGTATKMDSVLAGYPVSELTSKKTQMEDWNLNNTLNINKYQSLSFEALTNIAVVNFKGINISEDEAYSLSDRLIIELVKTKYFNVIEREMMNDVLKEQGFQLTGCTSDECMVQIGRLVGVQKIIGGSISKIGNIYSVSSRIVNVETGEIEKTQVYDHTGDIEQLLTDGMKIIAIGLTTTTKELFNNDNEKPKINLDDLKETPSNKFIPFDEPPKPKSAIRPKYPKEAKEMGIVGTVIIQAFVNEEGKVTETLILAGYPDTGLDDAATEAIKKTQFKPAKARGKPVGVWISIPVNFKQ